MNNDSPCTCITVLPLFSTVAMKSCILHGCSSTAGGREGSLEAPRVLGRAAHGSFPSLNSLAGIIVFILPTPTTHPRHQQFPCRLGPSPEARPASWSQGASSSTGGHLLLSHTEATEFLNGPDGLHGSDPTHSKAIFSTS